MPGIAIAALMFLILAAVVGTSLAIGAPWLAVPIVFLILVVWGGTRIAAARDGHSPGIGEEDVSGERIEFTDEDRRTLTPASATPPSRPGSEPAA